LLQRIASPSLKVTARGTLIDRIVDGRLTLRSAAIDLSADGAIDLRNNALDNGLVELKLARPEALLRNMRGRDVAARVRLDGPIGAPGYEYLVTAKALAFDKTIIHDMRASGKGRSVANGTALIPVSLRARRLEGQGELVEGIFRNFALDGVLQLKGQQIVSNPMKIRSEKLRGELLMIADLKTGRYDFGLNGSIEGLAIKGLGVVDLTSKLRAVPGAGGAFGLSGQAQARMRRLDNGFLRGLAGGLPVLRSGLSLGADKQLAFRDLTLTAPSLTLAASGYRRRDGSFHFEGSGAHKQYGPLRLTLDGKIDRPAVDLLLQRPMDALGLKDVRVVLTPDEAGYDFTAAGGSTLGPFTGNGVILLPPGGAQSVVRVARLAVADVIARGDIRPVTGGLDGRLAVSGPLQGDIVFAPVGEVQQLVLALQATDASFAGPTRIDVRQGKLDATILLDPAGTSIKATAQARGMRIGGVRLGRLAANADLVDGRGKIRASLSGQRGRLFDLQGEADVAPDMVRIAAQGQIDRRPIRILRTAVLTRSGDGWRLAPATVSFGGGSVQLAGEFSSAAIGVEARMNRMPLSLLDIASDNLGLGGTATGSLSYAQPRDGAPTGMAELRLRGLSRSGLSLSSRPVDIGLNGVLTADRLAARMLFVSEGKTIGRGQALLTPLGQGGFVTRIENAPLFAQLRYNGTADTLWRLTGVEIVDISGPVALTADARGTIANPVIAGNLSTDAAAISSPVTGMRLKGVKARGRFSGAQLLISGFQATAQNGGTVNGSGRFDFGGIKGVGMDLAFAADNAALLERDDIAATVTGPITLKSDGVGGTVGGDLTLNKSRFTLGRAAAVAQIPELKTVEINRRGEEFERVPRFAPWALAIKAKARNRLTVTGLGLDSEWRADLDIGGTVTSPAISGTADLVRGGYEFAGRRFDLRQGRIRFDGRTPVNPTLDIEAEANVSDLSATIRVTGTGLAPIISFTSIPALPEDELLSRILFGTTITNLSAPEALQLASAVGSLQGGGGLDPINAVRKAAGLDRLRIIAADPTQGQGTSIAAGKYLTRKTYVELITDGQGYSATRIEYQVTRWLALLGAISTLGRESANVRVSKDY
jgi:translocation and assembly module TamB